MYGDDSFEDDSGDGCEDVSGGDCLEDGIEINGLVDVLKIDMKNISSEDVGRYDFGDLEAAYLFYSWYGRMNGFSVRKSRVVKSRNGEKLQ